MDELLSSVDKVRKLQEFMGMGQQSMGAQQGFPGPQPMGPPRNYNGYQDYSIPREAIWIDRR